MTLHGLVERYQHFEEPAASIFMVILEAVGSSETLVPFCQTTKHPTSQDSNPHTGGGENLKCRIRGISLGNI